MDGPINTAEQLALYAACIYQPDDTVEVRLLRYFPATNSTRPEGSTWHTASSLYADTDRLLERNADSVHVYVGALARNVVGGATDADVLAAGSCFVDFDGIGVDEGLGRIRSAQLPEPTLAVASGHGLHAYWRFDEPLFDLDLWQAIQERLIFLLHSDRTIKNPSRIMRLPGFRNHKPPPADCRVLFGVPDRYYAVDDFTAALDGAVEPPADPDANGNGQHVVSPIVKPQPSRLTIIGRATLFAAKVENKAEGDGRNHAGYNLSAGLKNDFQLTDDEAWPILTAWNAGNRPPMSEVELRDVLANGTKYADRPAGHALRYDSAALPANLAPRPKTASDILSHAERLLRFPLLRQPVIHGILRRGETMNVIAPPKVGKSWMVMNLALSIVAGRSWMGYPVEPGPVLIVDNELHDETSTYRTEKVAEAMRLDAGSYEDDLHTLGLRGALQNFYALGSVFRAMPHARYRVIIVDAFYRGLPGDVDENSNANIAGVYNLIDQYAHLTGACFVLVHHSSKGNQGEKTVTDVGSGAGSISRAADTHLVLRQHEEAGVYVVDGAVRSWHPIEPRCVRWVWPLWQDAPECDPYALRVVGGRKAKLEPIAPPAPKEPPSAASPAMPPESATDALLRVMGDAEFTEAMLYAVCSDVLGWSRSEFRVYLGVARGQNLVEKVPVRAGSVAAKPTFRRIKRD